MENTTRNSIKQQSDKMYIFKIISAPRRQTFVLDELFYKSFKSYTVCCIYDKFISQNIMFMRLIQNFKQKIKQFNFIDTYISISSITLI